MYGRFLFFLKHLKISHEFSLKWDPDMVGMISFDEQAGQCLWLIGHYAIENCHSKPESQTPLRLR
jgi:hypothetical protein